MPEQQGFGIVTWNSIERQSRRYGSFCLIERNFAGTATVVPMLADISALLGKRVKVTMQVVETRKSAHCGDLFLNIYPSTPKQDEIIVLGIGILDTGYLPNMAQQCIIIQPDDGRAELWLDPTTLFRLHDQTVRMYLEETAEPCHPAPCYTNADAGMKSNGDGTFQISGIVPPSKVVPKIEVIERQPDGFLLSWNMNFTKGENVDYIP